MNWITKEQAYKEHSKLKCDASAICKGFLTRKEAFNLKRIIKGGERWICVNCGYDSVNKYRSNGR